MTNEITPPPELVLQWCHEDGDEIKTSPRWFRSVCAKAARWGADQELEACCEYLTRCAAWEPWEPEDIQEMRDLRRPKPPSLKKLALAALDDAVMRGDCITTSDALPKIRRALESLPD